VSGDLVHKTYFTLQPHVFQIAYSGQYGNRGYREKLLECGKIFTQMAELNYHTRSNLALVFSTGFSALGTTLTDPQTFKEAPV